MAESDEIEKLFKEYQKVIEFGTQDDALEARKRIQKYIEQIDKK